MKIITEDRLVKADCYIPRKTVEKLNIALSIFIDAEVNRIKNQIQTLYPDIKTFHVEHDKKFDDHDNLYIRVTGILPAPISDVKK